MIFPVDEHAQEEDGRKWVSINPRWWFLFDIDVKRAVPRKTGSKNEFTLWEPANMSKTVYEVADVDELVKYLFPVNFGNWPDD